MLAHVTTFAIDGIEPRRGDRRGRRSPGLPAFSIVGLGDRSVREARERVRGAILNSGFAFPAESRHREPRPGLPAKAGPGFDLAIACGVLAASHQVPAEPLQRLAVFGELGLDGKVRSCNGALAVAEGVLRAGLEGVIVPWERVDEAAIVEAILVGGAATSTSVAAVLRGEEEPDRGTPAPCLELTSLRSRGRPWARRADRSAGRRRAGGHNVLLSGPPGTGKDHARAPVPSILPPLTPAEALEVTRIRSVAGVHVGGLAQARPFRRRTTTRRHPR
jgi:magnesium chelatase family protein